MEEKVVKKIQKEVEETKRLFKEKIAALILGGFGLVAALACPVIQLRLLPTATNN